VILTETVECNEAHSAMSQEWVCAQYCMEQHHMHSSCSSLAEAGTTAHPCQQYGTMTHTSCVNTSLVTHNTYHATKFSTVCTIANMHLQHAPATCTCSQLPVCTEVSHEYKYATRASC
jgi:hypothetical protein